MKRRRTRLTVDDGGVTGVTGVTVCDGAAKRRRGNAKMYMSIFTTSDKSPESERAFIQWHENEISSSCELGNQILSLSIPDCHVGESKKTIRTIDSVSSIEDIFLHILGFLFSSRLQSDEGILNEGYHRALVDGETVRAAMMVSKDWYRTASSKELWSIPSSEANECTQTWLDVDWNFSLRKWNVGQENSQKPIVMPVVSRHLVGYVNLGLQAKGKDGNWYKAIERSTGEIYAIKIPKFAIPVEDIATLPDSTVPATTMCTNGVIDSQTFRRPRWTQPCATLREIALSGKLNEAAQQFNLLRGKRVPRSCNENTELYFQSTFASLPTRVQLVHGHVIRWYKFYPWTIQDFITTRNSPTISRLPCQANSCQYNSIPISSSCRHIRDRSCESCDRKKSAFSVRDARNLLQQLLKALHNLHCVGVIHRNLKPKHLLLDSIMINSNVEATNAQEKQITGVNFSQAVLKISGLSRFVRSTAPKGARSFRVGNLPYAAPETLWGQQDFTPAVDMWSVGCIFAEMVTGVQLFKGLAEQDQLKEETSIAREATESRRKGGAKSKVCRYAKQIFSAKEEMIGLWKHVQALDECGVDLLTKLLAFDPRERISAFDALNHPFFSDTTRDKARIEINAPAVKYQSKKFECNILEHLQDRESIWVRPLKSCSLSSVQWATLTDWMIGVVDVLRKDPRTAFLAMALFDRFVSTTTAFPSEKFKLLAATCLHIASKCEDEDPVGVPDLVFCVDDAFSGREVVSLEQSILHHLDWNFAQPTIYDFIGLYIDLADELKKNERAQSFARFFTELILHSVEHLSFKPSKVAACAMSLALHCAGVSNTWPAILQQASGFEQCDLERCLTMLWKGIAYVRTTMPQLYMASKNYGLVANDELLILSLEGLNSFPLFETTL